uniref:FAD-binding domain-containing protein n=1 Tax=Schlesneria paludicola TaxID=360056 RepID=A0A7C2NZ07_9PLAN
MSPVVIVGAGPTGLTLSLLLAKRGMASVLVERDSDPKRHPAAHVLNTRTMEVFREIGVAQELEAACQPQERAAYISWVVSVTGRLLGREPIAPPDLDSILALSPTRAIQFPQNRLEQRLQSRVRESPLIDFRTACTCEAVEPRADQVAVTVRRRGASDTERITGEWLVACDGASSPVRRMLGIRAEGPVLQYMLGIYFTADLSRHVDGRESTLYWLMNPQAPGVLVSYWLPDEWVLNVPYFPPQQQPADFPEPLCRELIYAALGTRDVPDLNVVDVSPWVMSARMAETFQRGRCLLAGDAAHTMPPTGGLGLNTGVQDAHNLAWKLAAVCRGTADASFLRTYELERRTIARRNIDISLQNLARNQAVHALAGASVQRLKLLVAIQNSWPFRQLPASWQAGLVRTAVQFGTRQFLMLDDNGPLGERLRARLTGRLPTGAEHYRIGGDLGGVYRRGAIIAEVASRPDADDPVLTYRPTTSPGARLPHVWLVDREGQRRSLFDLLEADGYLLLVHAEGQPVWDAAIAQARSQTGWPVRCLAIGEGAEHQDPSGTWRPLSEVEPTGAILVRPDGHVAWRTARVESPQHAATALTEALQRLHDSGAASADEAHGTVTGR